MVPHSSEWSQSSIFRVVLIFVVWVQSFYHVIIISPTWREIVVQYHTSLCDHYCIAITEIHPSVKDSEALYQDPKHTFYNPSCSAVPVVKYKLILR